MLEKRNLTVRAVIIYDDNGNYVIHGSSTGTPSDLYKAVAPLWDFNPCNETIRYVEIPMAVPAVEAAEQVRVYGTHGE